MIARESDGHRRDRAGLNHEKKRPAVKETPERREGFTQVNILAAGLRHHRCQLAIGKRRHECQHTGDEPDDKQPTRRTDLAGND